MIDKDICKIKKNGKLVAIENGEFGGFQYWRYNGVVYSVSTSGESYNIWCSEKELGRHLHRLWQVTGKKFFSEGLNMTVIDKQFVSGYQFA